MVPPSVAPPPVGDLLSGEIVTERWDITDQSSADIHGRPRSGFDPSPPPCPVSPVPCPKSPMPCPVSPVPCPKSPVPCPASPVPCPKSPTPCPPDRK